MSGRILVVDDIESNRRLLEARLSAEYFDVLQADSGTACLDVARAESPDVILLDVMMPGIDGFETCRRLKDDPKTRHIPVVMVTALDQREDRVRGLEAGADDFLTKPVNDIALFARVRSLLRLKLVMDELRLREDARPAIEAENAVEAAPAGGHVLVVAPDDVQAERLAARLPARFSCEGASDPRTVMTKAQRAELIIVDLSSPRFDGLRVCARLRAEADTRHTPILGIVDPDTPAAMVRALDIGVSDVVARPVDSGELAARAMTQLKRKRYTDRLRDRLEESLEMAVTDQLTGLHNRRYLNSRLRSALEGVELSGEAFSLVLFDIDHFKRINDTYGHQAGDDVLKGFATRMGRALRAVDVAGRYGGEEFLVLLTGAHLDEAARSAERVRAAIATAPFTVAQADALGVTVSAGCAQAVAGDSPESLLARADAALYEAKAAGRNKVAVAKKKAA
ncbi:MAG: PleD family two-component system response regulator [Pseudomonadota bacterium]